MTVNEKGLEPCPFCGGPAELDNAAEPQFARRPTVTCANEDCFGYMPSAYFATDKEAIAAWNRRASIVGAEPVLANVLGDENDLHSVSHALDIGGIGTPYRAYQGSLYCDYQPHRIADFQDYGLALAASVLFNSAKAIKAALAHPAPSAGEGGVKGLAGAEYEAIHRRAIEAYEAATPPDYRYSATALRKAVDAARAEEARILTAIEPVAASPGVPDVLSRCACGGAPALYAPDVKSETKYAASVVCHHCGVSMQMANHDSDPKRVVAAWNRAHPHRINTMTVNEKGLDVAREGTRDLTFSALTFDEHNDLIAKAIEAYLRAASNDAEPVAWTSSGNLDGLRDHDSLVIGSMCNRQGDGWTVPLYLTAIEPVAASPSVGDGMKSLAICLQTYGLDYMQCRHVLAKVETMLAAAPASPEPSPAG